MSSKRKTSSLCSCFGTDVSWTQHDPTRQASLQNQRVDIRTCLFKRTHSRMSWFDTYAILCLCIPKYLVKSANFGHTHCDRTRDRMWTAWSPISPRRRRVWCRCRRRPSAVCWQAQTPPAAPAPAAPPPAEALTPLKFHE
jgi:hypothetical protein